MSRKAAGDLKAEYAIKAALAPRCPACLYSGSYLAEMATASDAAAHPIPNSLRNEFCPKVL